MLLVFEFLGLLPSLGGHQSTTQSRLTSSQGQTKCCRYALQNRVIYVSVGVENISVTKTTK